MKKFFLVFLLVLTFLLASCGGGSDEEENAVPYPTIPLPTPVVTISPTARVEETIEEEEEEEIWPPEGHVLSHLTGLPILEEMSNRRPFIIVFNNEPRALPQSGISTADIVYEVLAEGNITRLIAVFHNLDETLEKLGPMRSTRHYFATIALEHDGIFVHHGGSVLGYTQITNLRMNAIDGMRYDGSTFWRDAERRRSRGLEHSSYTSFENLRARSETLNFREYLDYLPIRFNFFEELSPISENYADIANVRLTNNNITRFEFNPDTKLYYKSIFGNPHMDAENDRQVAVRNVIVQITDITLIPGDTEGRRNVRLTGTGEGYLVSMGTYMPITWERVNEQSPTLFFNEAGELLTLNAGQTWITITSLRPTFETFLEEEEDE